MGQNSQYTASYNAISFMRVIDVRTGKVISEMVIRLTSQRAMELVMERIDVYRSSRTLQWLADGSGWVIGYQCIVDRVSGHGIFVFPDSFLFHSHPVIVLSPTQILCTNTKLLPHAPAYRNHIQTIENLTLPKELPATVANIRAGGDLQDLTLPLLSHPVMTGVRTLTESAPSGAGPVEALPPTPPGMALSPIPLHPTFGEDHPFIFTSPATGQVFTTKSYRVTEITGDWTDFTHVVIFSLAGRQLFDIPFPAICDLQDVSPDGSEFIVRDPARDRRPH